MEKKEKIIKKDGFVYNMLSVLGTIVLTLLFINFVAQFAMVNGESMANTLHHGNIVLVEKITKNLGTFKRFDVIIFRTNFGEHHFYIKRVIGLPGDTVFISQEGKIFINGNEIAENYGLERINNPGIAITPITLKDDEYFVLGDNRNNSQDSRIENVGNVNKKDILGKVVFSLSPLKSVSKEQY